MTKKSDIYRSLPGVDTVLETLCPTSSLPVSRELAVKAIQETLKLIRNEIALDHVQRQIPTESVVAIAGSVIQFLSTGCREELTESTGNGIWPGTKSFPAPDRFAILAKLVTGAENNLAAKDLLSAIELSLEAKEDGERTVIVPTTCLTHMKGHGYLLETILSTGARVVETGCTNRYHVKDVQKCLATQSGRATVLYANRPQVRTLGFTHEPSVNELSKVCREHNAKLAVIDWTQRSANYLHQGVDIVISPFCPNHSSPNGCIYSLSKEEAQQRENIQPAQQFLPTSKDLRKLEDYLFSLKGISQAS